MAGRSLADATIFIATPYAMNVRDVLRSDIYKEILRAGPRVVLLCAAADDPAFVQEFARPNVHLEKLVVHQPVPREIWLDTLRFTLFADLTRSIGIRADPIRKRSLAKRAAVGLLMGATQVTGRRRTEAALAWMQRTVYPDPYYESLFRKYRPDLVCLTRPFDLSGDMSLLKRAKAEGVPTLVLVASWDNLTSKGVFPARVDRLVVWNDLMAREAVELHGYSSEQVFVGGVPQFDLYFDRSRLPNRETFFRKVGADPSKRLITFTLATKTTVPQEMEVVVLLWRALQSGAIPSSQLLLRMHPQEPREFPRELADRQDVLVETPGKMGALPHRDLATQDIQHLAATMLHSDVVVNSASTTCIDAAVFDTPVVCVAFDGTVTDLPLQRSVRRRYEHTHIQKLLQTGGVRVGWSLDETLKHINEYLARPELDREGRARLVEQQCGRIDGKSGERIGRYVIESLATFKKR